MGCSPCGPSGPSGPSGPTSPSSPNQHVQTSTVTYPRQYFAMYVCVQPPAATTAQTIPSSSIRFSDLRTLMNNFNNTNSTSISVGSLSRSLYNAASGKGYMLGNSSHRNVQIGNTSNLQHKTYTYSSYPYTDNNNFYGINGTQNNNAVTPLKLTNNVISSYSYVATYTYTNYTPQYWFSYGYLNWNVNYRTFWNYNQYPYEYQLAVVFKLPSVATGTNVAAKQDISTNNTSGSFNLSQYHTTARTFGANTRFQIANGVSYSLVSQNLDASRTNMFTGQTGSGAVTITTKLHELASAPADNVVYINDANNTDPKGTMTVSVIGRGI